MRGPQLLAGYVIRVAVQGNRWQITLVDLREQRTTTYDSFTALAKHLELEAAKRAVAG